MSLLRKSLVFLKLYVFLALAALCTLLVCAVYTLIPTLQRVDSSSAILFECKRNPNCIPSMVQAIGGSVRATSGQIAKAAPDIATSLKLMAEHSAAASDQTEMLAEEGTKTVARLSGLVDNVDGMVSDLRKDIYTANTLISDLDAGIKPLLESGDDSVKSLKVTLDEFTKLEVALNEQLSVGSPEVLATLTAMRKLAEDEKWDQTLDHIEAATNSGAEILSTVDQSTRFLRKKMGQLRFVLTRIASMIKVSFIPF